MQLGKHSSASVLVLLALAFQLQPSVLAQNSLRYGTWKLNLAKSTYDPGPSPKGETRTYKANADGLANTTDRIEADGTHTAIHWAVHFDGKDYPYVGSAAYDTMAVTSTDAFTNLATLKKAGKVVTTNRSVIARDGKTLNITTTSGTDGSGRPLHNVTVFDKQ